MKSERILYSFILVLIFSVLLTSIRTKMTFPYLNNLEAENRFWVVKTHNQNNYDVVMLGDSRVYRGLSPATMEQTLSGVRILNLGYSGGGLNKYMYEEADKKIDPNSCAKAVVLGISPHSLTSFAAQNSQYIQEKTRSMDYVYSKSLFPSMEEFMSPFNEEMLNEYFISKINKSNMPGNYQEFYDDGWAASWSIPEDLSALSSYTELFQTRKVSYELVKELMDQTILWRKQNILVFAFRTPTHPQMVTLENNMSGFDEKLIFQEFEKIGGIWLNFSNNVYHSYDGSHLDKEAAIQFSRDLATQMLSIVGLCLPPIVG